MIKVPCQLNLQKWHVFQMEASVQLNSDGDDESDSITLWSLQGSKIMSCVVIPVFPLFLVMTSLLEGPCDTLLFLRFAIYSVCIWFQGNKICNLDICHHWHWNTHQILCWWWVRSERLTLLLYICQGNVPTSVCFIISINLYSSARTGICRPSLLIDKLPRPLRCSSEQLTDWDMLDWVA